MRSRQLTNSDLGLILGPILETSYYCFRAGLPRTQILSVKGEYDSIDLWSLLFLSDIGLIDEYIHLEK